MPLVQLSRLHRCTQLGRTNDRHRDEHSEWRRACTAQYNKYKESIVKLASECLSKTVCRHIASRDLIDLNPAGLYLLFQPVLVDVDMV